MAHTNFFPSKTFFYPLGNTSPISLAEHIASGADADFLLLGCGDPRNILYTIYSSGLDTTTGPRKFDFTCVDIEPAILARNILLLSLISEKEYPDKAASVWDIFYHFLLDDAALALLVKQSQKLADLSISYDTWRGGEYSSFIKIGDRTTLEDLHRVWNKYAATDKWTPAQTEQFKKTFVTGMNAISSDKQKGADITASRSAGPLAIQAAAIIIEATRQFWKTGVTYTTPGKVKAATNVNPTFAYAIPGDGFVAHRSTMPLTAFHLTPAFAPTAERPNQTPNPTTEDLFELARAQFRSWCDAFRSCLRDTSAARVVIRVLTCDALAFCRALRAKTLGADPSTFPRVSPWRAPILALDGAGYANNTAPLHFDAIDTSNLADHLGILNVLIAASPLLKRLPSSVMYTETLLTYGEDPIVAFSNSLCGDVSTMSILFDLSPSSFVAGYTTSSNIHEIMSYHALSAITSKSETQYHERLAWKAPSQFGGVDCPVSFEPLELSRLLFSIYLKMFAAEDMSGMLWAKRNLASLQERERIHYCRATFILFVTSLMDRIAVDWNQVTIQLIQCIIDDRTLVVGMNYYQEFLSLLHIQRIYDEQPLIAGNPLLSKNKAIGPFHNWSVAAIPPLCTITLSLPRSAFKLLYEDGAMRIPIIALELCGPSYSNIFSSVDIMFGTISIEGDAENAKGIVHEDPLGSRGNGPMLVSACVPSWILANDPRNMSVAAKVITTPSTAILSKKLGLQMYLYKVPFAGHSNVHVLRERPSTSRDIRAAIPYATADGQVPSSSNAVAIRMDSSGKKIATMTHRIEFHDFTEQTAFASKDNAVTIKQVGPSTVEVGISTIKSRLIAFPCVVGGTNLKTRIARKSSWLEVVVSPTLLGKSNIEGGISKRFPVLSRDNSYLPWNIHHIHPDRLPTLSTSDTHALEWLSPHVSLAFSDRERSARDTETMDPLTQLKDSLHVLFVRAAGIQGGVKVEVFGLNRTSEGGIDTLLFVTSLKLDLPNHTVALDAFALPLHMSILQEVLPVLQHVQVCTVNLTDEEHIAWKALLPSLVERCRTWEHKPDCAYKKNGATIPLSTTHGETPICDCGRGKVTDSFRRRKEWLPFLPYVTRVAISPLFAVSYLESVGGEIAQLVGSPAGRRTASSGTAGICRMCKVALSSDKQLRCSKCKKVTYCSRECQVKDWKEHKMACTKAA